MSFQRSTMRSFLMLVTAITLIAALHGLFFPRPAQAATTTIVVNTNNDDSSCSGGTVSLRCAISAAYDNTTSSTLITFNFSGIIKLDSLLTINSQGQPITIDGSGQSIAVDGGDYTQVFDIVTNTTVALNALTITNGHPSYDHGGGIHNDGTLTINNTTLSNNSATQGGGIENDSTLTIINSTFSNNSTSGFGGAIYNTGTLTIINSTLHGNTAGARGGGILNTGSLTISDSTFSGNHVSLDGGAVANNGVLRISNSTLSGNSAATGGGVSNEGGESSIFNSTVSGNSGTIGGSGIAITNDSTLNILSTIVAHNTKLGGLIGLSPDIVVSGTLNSLGHNLIGDGTGVNGFINSDQVGNLIVPIDPELGDLANNRGPTQTMALLNGSPAIGKGDCTANSSVNPPVSTLLLDQRGIARKLPCDVGAYEMTPSDTSMPVTTATELATTVSTPLP